MKQFDDLHEVLQRLHLLQEIAFTISYSDPKDGYLLPINNDDNFAKAIECARPLLRIFLQRKGGWARTHEPASTALCRGAVFVLCDLIGYTLWQRDGLILTRSRKFVTTAQD